MKSKAFLFISFIMIGLGLGYYWTQRPSTASICESLPPSATPPSCRATAALNVLDVTAPVTALFVGYSPGLGLADTIAAIITTLAKHGESIKVNVLYAEDDELAEAQDELKALTALQSPSLNLISVPDQEAIWAQDFMMTAWRGRGPVLLDLPYRQNEGDDAPKAIAQACQIPLLAGPTHNDGKNLADDNGAYGGNIEAITDHRLAIGNNTPKAVADFLAKQSQTTAVSINVDWLQTGHVDALMQAVPNMRAKAGECPVALVMASPAVAMELLAKAPPSDVPLTKESNFQHFATCGKQLSAPNQSESCAELVKANKTYERISKAAAADLSRVIENDYGCAQVRVIDLPVLFMPAMILDTYGGELDEARGAIPNPVNGISLNSVYVAPNQVFPDFQNDVKTKLTSLGLHVLFVDGDNLHRLGGGLHCWSQTLRRCG